MIEEKQFFVEGTVKKFIEKQVEIILTDGQKIFWPIKNLPEDIEVNSQVKLFLKDNNTTDEEREKMAQTILNNILKK